jgi:hypothetical protein
MTLRPLVCLVDPHDNGHHPMYAAAYAGALAALDADVRLVVPPALVRAMPSVGTSSAAVVPWEATSILRDSACSAEAKASRLWKSLGGVLDVHSREWNRYPDFVVHLFVDSFVTDLLPRTAIEGRIRCPFAGLWFKPPTPLGWGGRDVAKRIIRCGRRYQALRSPLWASILLLDPVGHGHLSRDGHPQVVGVPEFSVTALPAVMPPLVAEVRRRAAGRRICALVGSVEGRKGVRAFLRTAAAAPADEWFFVMAGKAAWETIEDDLRGEIGRLTSGPDSRVFLVDRWLDDETLNAVIAASGLLHACYEHWPYSSNMLCKAAAFRVPAIVAEEGYLGRMVRAYGLGPTVPSGEQMPARFSAGFADEMASFAAGPAFLEGCGRYLAANRPEALVDALRSGLGDLLRVPLSNDPTTTNR